VADAVFLRHFEIGLPQLVALNGGCVDDKFGPIERGAAIDGMLDLQARAGSFVHQPAEVRAALQTAGIPANQRQRAAREFRRCEHVPEHAEAEGHAPGAYKHDLGFVGHW